MQLIQGVDVLFYVLSTGRKPSDFILVGDSAGGNLIVEVVAHVTHPHPDSKVERLQLEEPLRAAVLMSPWVSFSTHFESWTTNKYKDYCPAELSKTFSEAWKGGSPPDNYNEPILAPSSFWEGLKVKDILITIGSFEVAADAMKEFAKKVEVGVSG
jgi:acetyl esterase/lipase